MSQEDDDELMARVAQQDQVAFGRLVAQHLDSLHRYLRRLTGSRADADELAQETLLRAWQRADTYRPGIARITTWLHRLAHNLAVDALRRRRREISESAPESGSGPAESGPGPEAQLVSRQLGERLDAAIAALPASQRAALLLCQVQGFSNQQAADIVGVSVRSLESLVARARRSLRQSLSDPPTGDPPTGDPPMRNQPRDDPYRDAPALPRSLQE